jgi:hypothetical protein
MAFPRARRLPLLLGAVGVVALAGEGRVRADQNDLQLLNHCPPDLARMNECSWVQRDPNTGGVVNTVPDTDGESRFRSQMSELGFAIAPRVMTPADTLGFAGFQFSAEMGVTKINPNRDANGQTNGQPYWNGIQAVNPGAPTAVPLPSYLTTVGGYVRKGLWLPLPAFEFGAGALSILGSRMYVLQGYAKFALQEGFHGWWLPSFAVRGSGSQLLGTSQVDLTVYAVDVLASKAFSVGGTARLEPFVGWSMLFISARSGVIDATPACDAYMAPGTLSTNPQCAASQDPSNSALYQNDLNANFTFQKQDVITRQRFFAGFKLRLSVVFVAAQVDIGLAGGSRDTSRSNGAIDRSGTQQTYSLSAGFDF